MITGKYLNKGKEGITCACNDGTALKIFFGPYFLSPSETKAEQEYEYLCKLFSAGINVPKPIGLEKVILEDSDVKGVGNLKIGTTLSTYSLKDLVGQELPAVRK